MSFRMMSYDVVLDQLARRVRLVIRLNIEQIRVVSMQPSNDFAWYICYSVLKAGVPWSIKCTLMPLMHLLNYKATFTHWFIRNLHNGIMT